MIPTAALRDRVTIDPYLGTDGDGAEVFGPKVSRVPARIVATVRQVRTSTGVDVTAVVPECTLRPGVDVAPQSRITRGAECWTVTDVRHGQELGRTWCQVLTLDGPRPAVTP